MYFLLEEPDSSSAAYALAVFVLILIILSSISFCAETVEAVKENDQVMEVIKFCDIFFIAVFTVEYLLRLFAADSQIAFVTASNNLIDLVAILPFYVEKIVGNFIDLRFLRLARVFRVFKLSRYGNRMQMVIDALVESKEIMAMLAVNLVIIIVVFSSITYFAEHNVDKPGGERFESIPHACWWCIVTILTVGYGDMYPVTTLGRLVATLLMVCSLIVLALPITIIGSCFSNSWVAYKEEQKLSQRVELLPKLVKQIYPAMHSYLQEFMDHNRILREKTGESYSLLDDLRTARKSNNVSSMSQHLTHLKSNFDSLMLLCDENVAKTNHHFDDIVSRLQMQQADSTKLRTEGLAVLHEMDDAIKSAMRDVFTLQHFRGKRDLSDFVGFLIITAIGGKNLVPKDLNGTSDPFLMCKHGSETVRSSTVIKSLNPLWDEELVVLLRNREEALKIEVYDEDRYQKEFMGRATRPIQDLEDGSTVTEWIPLEGVKEGSLKLAFEFKTFANLKQEDLNRKQVFDALCSLVLPNAVPLAELGEAGEEGEEDAESAPIHPSP